MTQNDKDLLLKDLCGRLPHGVKCKILETNEVKILSSIQYDGENTLFDFWEDDQKIHYGYQLYFSEFRPYLLPLSSMTYEQKEFIKNKFCYDWDIDDHPYSLWAHCIDIGDIDELIDWFHKNHFDWRGLIPKGLANDATGLNIY